jgi:hypothetical protein
LKIGEARISHFPVKGLVPSGHELPDWLSFRYKVLFLVSAGNILGWLPVRNYVDRQSFQQANIDDRENHILDALNQKPRFSGTSISPTDDAGLSWRFKCEQLKANLCTSVSDSATH